MNKFLFTLARLAQLQAEAVDRVALHEAAKAAYEDNGDSAAGSAGAEEEVATLGSAVAGTANHERAQAQLATVCRHLQVKPAQWLRQPHASAVPALLHHPERGWGVLRGQNGQGQWVAEWLNAEKQAWNECLLSSAEMGDCQIARVRLQKPYEANSSVSVTNLASITGAADALWNSVAIGTANTNTSLALSGLQDGSYKLYSVDAAGNLSQASSASLTVQNTLPPLPPPTVLNPPVDGDKIAAGSGGFVINGNSPIATGYHVKNAGDVNGDGLNDVIVGTRDQSGSTYVVFGKADGNPVNLSAVTAGTGGYLITGPGGPNYYGSIVSGVGDVIYGSSLTVHGVGFNTGDSAAGGNA